MYFCVLKTTAVNLTVIVDGHRTLQRSGRANLFGCIAATFLACLSQVSRIVGSVNVLVCVGDDCHFKRYRIRHWCCELRVEANADNQNAVYERGQKQHRGQTVGYDGHEESQFVLMVGCRVLAEDVVDTLGRSREARIGLQEEASDEADAILKELRQIEGLLMFWAGSEAHPMMHSPPGLTEKLNSLSNAVSGGDAKPTASMYAVFEDLAKRFEIQRNRVHQVIDQ